MLEDGDGQDQSQELGSGQDHSGQVEATLGPFGCPGIWSGSGNSVVNCAVWERWAGCLRADGGNAGWWIIMS